MDKEEPLAYASVECIECGALIDLDDDLASDDIIMCQVCDTEYTTGSFPQLAEIYGWGE